MLPINSPRSLRSFGFGLALRLLAAALIGNATAGGAGLPNLAEKPQGTRFQIKAEWPAEVGAADVALWYQDKTAALSVTIDDNNAPDFPFWLEKSAKHGFRATWFVITGRVSGNQAYWGTWEQFAALRAAGHEIESHTVTHLHPTENWAGIAWEYAESIRQIEAGIPGAKVRTLAYPGGKNSKLNDRAEATKLYLAARGTVGRINSANQIDYLGVNGMTGYHLGENPKAPWADLRQLLTLGERDRGYRGWAVLIFHKVKDPADLDPLFAFMDQNREALWLGGFTEIARYGQQRDTARLKTLATDANSIRLALADEMDDASFDQALTLRVRVPTEWTGAKATQGGRPTSARLVRREDAALALVDAVPDRGEIVVTKQP